MTAVTPRKICAVVREETVDQARAAIKKAGTVADLIELRLDYLKDFDFASAGGLATLIGQRAIPTIITCRSIAEGGRNYVDDVIRIKLLVEGARRFADFCDIELAHYRAAAALNPDLSRLIVSYHNFKETPENLDEIYTDLSRYPAAVHKIATKARATADSLVIFRLLDRARTENRRLIAIAMGEPGLITRILGPSRGSFLTYGAIEADLQSAPAQPTCDQLRSVYRVDMVTEETSITGIVGNPVSHSVSPAMHNAAFRALDLDFVYLPVKVDDISDFFSQFVRPGTRQMNWGLRGFSITIPHKIAALQLVDQVDRTAESAGAINTLVVESMVATGYNTDVQGFLAPIDRICNLSGTECAVIGAGGSARAAVYGLLRSGARVTVFARNPDAARQLEQLGARTSPLDEFGASTASVVINTTPVGMRGHSEGLSPVQPGALAGRAIAYDLVYNPQDTMFLEQAKEQGCRTIGGIEMLVAQAALQFQLWTGRQAPVDLLREAAINELSSQNQRALTNCDATPPM